MYPFNSTTKTMHAISFSILIFNLECYKITVTNLLFYSIYINVLESASDTGLCAVQRIVPVWRCSPQCLRVTVLSPACSRPHYALPLCTEVLHSHQQVSTFATLTSRHNNNTHFLLMFLSELVAEWYFVHFDGALILL